MKAALRNWLCPREITHFLTLTFVDGMHEPAGYVVLSEELISKTVDHLMHKLERVAFGNINRKRKKNRKPIRGKVPKKQELSRVTFIEWSAADKLHAHVGLELPSSMTTADFQGWMYKTIPSINWLRPQFKIKQIDDTKGFIRYGSKDGAASFCPHSTRLSFSRTK